MPRDKNALATKSTSDEESPLVGAMGEIGTDDSLEAEPVKAPPEVTINEDQLLALGRKLTSDFEQYERDRRPVEKQWAKNLRQFRGEYDPEVKSTIEKGRSLAYPRVTRVKVVSMLSRLMNLLFPADDKNWSITASPVPNLQPEDLQKVLDQLQQDPNAQLTDEAITQAVIEYANERAMNLSTEIEDQLSALGGNANLSYVALARRVLLSGIMYGVGILKGPFVSTQMQTRWELQQQENGTQKIVPKTIEARVPQYDFCPVWDHYFDMSARYLHQMDGCFQRLVYSRSQVRALMNDKMFFAPKIEKWLKMNPQGNFKERQHEAELRNMNNSEPNAVQKDTRKYEIIVWDGKLSGHYLKGCGVDISDDKLHEMIGCSVWMLGDVVIRCNLNPWVILEEEEEVRTYHYFVFEEDDSCIVGNGLPQIIRDSQLGICAAVRMTLDNAGIVCGPSVEVNMALIREGTDTTSIHAYQVWQRDEDESSATANIPAVRPITYNAYIKELQAIATMFQGFADQETFVNPATGGDMQKGPSEPFRTAAGASMLQGLAALPFKDVVRNFDVFTESFMHSMVMFNKHFNDKESIRGDFQVVARGATSLIAKEVRGLAIDELARSLTPGEALYADWKGFFKERCRSRDIPIETVMVSEEEATRREQAQAEQNTQQQEQMQKLIHAETRKALADAVKSLTQADKNSAAASATIYNALAQGIENGISPSIVAATRSGEDVPRGAIEAQRPSPPKNPDGPPAAGGKPGAKGTGSGAASK